MFDLRERLRGDFASTMNGYAVGKQWGFYSTNDVRKELGENPIGPVGDVYWTPVNMQNSELLLDTESIQDQPIGTQLPAQNDAARQYLRLYRDVVGRLAARSIDKRDLATVKQIFEPLLASIAELGAERAKRNTRSPEWQYEPTKAIADYLQKLTERAATWKPEDLDSIAAQELQKVIKTLTLAPHRSVAEHVALKVFPMAHKLERRNIKATEIRMSTGADGSQILTGYAVRFNSPSVDLGGFTEVCAPGMFTRTLKESPDVLMLRDRSTAGQDYVRHFDFYSGFKWSRVSVTMPKTAIADTVENVRNGNLSSCSFGFNVPSGGDKWTTTPDGTQLRTLLDVNLAEVSITSFAGYPATSVSLRSCPPEIRSLITRSNEEGCDCDCEECMDDDSENCSMDDCQDPTCAESGCPAQNGGDERTKPLSQSERLKLHMRLELAKRK
jgi:HK97 family phage prohead protease